MTIDQVLNTSWTRKHDRRGTAFNAPKICFPKSLEELIEICRTRTPSESLKAAGSHWSLSEAAISDNVFIETHDPDNRFQAMGRTLYDVVPGCLNDDLINFMGTLHPRQFDDSHSIENEGTYLVHFETGKKVFQLYSELDKGDDDNRSLAQLIKQRYGNDSYLGSLKPAERPWAFQTLGGAGGQTVFGALTTGTHGGDWRFPPIADSVVALHLVADGGKHYWIEPGFPPVFERQLTDDEKLRRLYGTEQYGWPKNFEIIRDDNIFNSVLISAGRFGIVYSVVLRAVRQYYLHEERRLTTWQEIKHEISNHSSHLYTREVVVDPGTERERIERIETRFLQISISPTPHDNFRKNRSGITKRWNVPLPRADMDNPKGRAERVGAVLEEFNTRIQGPRFQHAGNSFAYEPDPGERARGPSMLETACSNSNFLVGIIETVEREVRRFIDDGTVVAGGVLAGVAAVAGPGAAAGLLLLVAPLAILLLVLLAFLQALRDEAASGGERRTLGEAVDDLRELLLNRSDPNERAAGLFIWQMIVKKMFEDQEKEHDYEAISYAVMDGHNYLDKSCRVNVDSIEVFFDATDPNLIAFIDALLTFEIRQEFEAKAFVGYISLRFTSNTRATIGMERFPRTCAVEIAGLKDVRGVTELIDFAIVFCLNRNIRGILHWGQRNGSTMADIQDRFGDSPARPGGALQTWRNALSDITDNGRLNGFSSNFTRRVGLEIVTPIIQNFRNETENPLLHQPITLLWDCFRNPPSTEITLDIESPSGAYNEHHTMLPLRGSRPFSASEVGEWVVTLTAIIVLNSVPRQSQERLIVTVT